MPALRDVGTAALYGAVPSGFMQGISEVGRLLGQAGINHFIRMAQNGGEDTSPGAKQFWDSVADWEKDNGLPVGSTREAARAAATGKPPKVEEPAPPTAPTGPPKALPGPPKPFVPPAAADREAPQTSANHGLVDRAENDHLASPPAVPGVPAEENLRSYEGMVRHAENPDIVAPPQPPMHAPPAGPIAVIPDHQGFPERAAGHTEMVEGKPITYTSFDPRTLGTDAQAFQYKGGANQQGVTDRLSGVQRWDPLAAGNVVVYESADGTRTIVDGHQRLGLAKRLLSEQEATGPERIVSSAIKAKDGRVFTGPLHSDAYAKAMAAGIDIKDIDAIGLDGFITSKGRYVGRREAQEIAQNAAQTKRPEETHLRAENLTSSIRMTGALLREKDGWTPADARAISAKKNIQEGSGDALDTARVFRDRPDMWDDSLPITSGKLRQAKGLSELSDPAWEMTLNGVVPQNHAALVGNMMPGKENHAAVMGELAKFKPQNENEARMMIADANSAGFAREVQETLFGKEEVTRSLYQERAQVYGAAMSLISEDKRIFATLAREAERIEGQGNVLVDTNADRAEQAAQLGQLLQKLATRSGPISAALNRAASSVVDGMEPRKAARVFLDEVAKLIARDGFNLTDLDRTDAEPETPDLDTPQGRQEQAKALEADLATAPPVAPPGPSQMVYEDVRRKLIAGGTDPAVADAAATVWAARYNARAARTGAGDAWDLYSKQNVEIRLAQSSDEGMPALAANALDTGIAPINSSGEAPPSTQPTPGFQVSTLPEPLGSSITREMPPSIFEGPAITRFSDFRLGDIDPSTNKLIIQGSNDWQALHAAAEENKPRLDEGLRQLVAGIDGAHVYNSRVKDKSGLEQKIKVKGRPASTISDYLGARIVVDTRAAMDEILAKLDRTGGVLEAESSMETSKEGYRAYHLQVGLGDGTSAELQIVPKPIAEVMRKAHAIRQPVKRLDLSDPANLAHYKDVMALGRQLYDNAWNKDPEWGPGITEPAPIPTGEEANVQQPDGGEIRPGAPPIPEGGNAARPQRPKRIRKPPELSGGGGELGVGDGRAPDGGAPQQAGGAEAALPGPSEGVTKPPSGGPGAGEARPDPSTDPRGAGLAEAEEKIAERTRSNYRITPDDQVGVGGPKTKINANIDAIRVLKLIEDEAREATPEEKATLVKYTGWGAFAQKMFSDRGPEFKQQRDALRALVTDEEYAAARASTLNAHYTSPDVIRGIWGALQHLGFNGGLALEPAAGVGHFIGLIPDSLASRTAWTATELDSLTGRIAKALYGDADINVQGFETLKRPSNYFDLAISNVPFGNFNLTEKPYGSYPIHDFFFVKSLDKVRPGGVVSFITSRYTMDRVDAGTRRELSKTADFVGAIRLPGGDKGAFAGNAGTEVTTDIIFLRKKVPGEPDYPGENWTNLKEISTPEGPVKINEYFADHPKMMLGEMRLMGSMYAKNEPVLIGDPQDLGMAIHGAGATMREGAFVPRGSPRPPVIDQRDIEPGASKEGAYFSKGGKVYRREQGRGVEQRLSGDDESRVKKLSGIRDIVNDLLKEQLSGGDKADALRKQLREAYDQFVKAHGPINKEETKTTKRLTRAGEPVTITKTPNFAPFKDDPDSWKVAAIEQYDAETGTAKPADIQKKDIIAPPKERQINGPADALAATLDATGRVDLQQIGQMLNVGSEEAAAKALGDLIFQNPNGRQWEPADRYLSGDVVKKLEEARVIADGDPAYSRNVAALEKVQPTPLTGTDIMAQFGAPWIPADVYEAFIKEIGGYNTRISTIPVTGGWKVKHGQYSSSAHTTYGTDRVSVDDVIDAAINNRQITVRNHVSSNPDVYEVDQGATEAARVRVEALKEAFTGDPERGIDAWAFADPERAQRLEAIYNRTYNNLVPRQFDGAHQTFPGLNPKFADRKHRKDAVWRIVQSGNTLLAHSVGSGKTVTSIAAVMEQKRLGLINKGAFAIPDHMLEQFAREFIEAYPNAKILVAQKEEMTREHRKAFIAKVAANDWDGVIMTHSAFGRINTSLEHRQNFIQEQLDELERARKAEIADTDDKRSPTVKALEKAKKKLEDKLQKLLNEERKDTGVSFEETGIDHLVIDESHFFKNLYFSSRLGNVKGLAQGDSQRAEDLFLKIRYLEQKRPGRSAVFATGTPVSNTMAELWTMMRYLELDRLKEAGLENFDAWASTFGKVVNNMELSADGRTFKEVSSFSKFVNVPELISLYSEIADTKTADMLKLPRPEVRTKAGGPGIEIVQATPSEEEELHIQKLVELAESLKGKRPEKGQPNMLSVVTAGRKVATDGRLIDPNFDFNPKGKIALAVKNIHEIWKKGKEPGTVQMVFLDMGVPQTKVAAKKPIEDEMGDPAQIEQPKIDLYADIKQRLVDKGIPAEQIAAIHDAKDDAAKGRLFKKVRAGDIRVLIGSSGKMGVGTNVQDRLIAMHHLDAPWKPAEVEQRDGRIVRQGNLNKQVQIFRYVTKRSFDAFMWQKLDTKSKFISQVLSGAKGSRHAEDIDNPLPEAAEMKAAASGDTRIMELAELDRQARQLSAQRRAHKQNVDRASWQINASRAAIATYEERLPTEKADGDRVQDLAGDKFKITVGGKVITERKAAGEAILKTVLALDASRYYTPKIINLGELSGFEMQMQVQTQYDSDGLYLKGTPMLKGTDPYGSPTQTILNKETDPGGLIRRFENLLGNIASRAKATETALADRRKDLEKLEKLAAGKWPKEAEYQQTLQKIKALSDSMKAPNPAATIEPETEKELAQGPALPGGAQRGAITFQGNQRIIKLFETADASTVMHEGSHLWFDELLEDASAPDASPQIKADAATALAFVGAKDRESLTPEHREKFSDGFEDYLASGKAPSEGLARVFEMFKDWLRKIYRGLLRLGRPISEEMRGVYDRLLATDEEIAAAARTAKEAGVPEPPHVMTQEMADQLEKAYKAAVKCMEGGAKSVSFSRDENGFITGATVGAENKTKVSFSRDETGMITGARIE
jgi:N12 class adenine-specific DNA methylase